MLRFLLPVCLFSCAAALGQINPAKPIPASRYFSPEVNRPGAREALQSVGDYYKSYSSWAELAERSRQAESPITLSLPIDSTSRKGDWASLRAVQHVYSLQLNLTTPLTQTLADSLLQTLASWPELVNIGINTSESQKLAAQQPSPAIDGRAGAQLKSVRSVLVSGLHLASGLQLVNRCPSVKSLSITNFGTAAYALPAEVSQMSQLESLMLYGKISLTDLDKTMSGLINLRSLQVTNSGDGNQLTTLTKQVPRLRKLHLSTSQQQSFAGLRLGHLTQLDTLNLEIRVKSAVSLDSVLADVTSLKVIDVYGGVQSSLNWMANNSALRRVRLSGCRVQSTGISLANLTQLTFLSLSSSDSLRQFPAQITTLPNVQELRLDAAGITEIPAAIGAMTSLTSLSLNSNKLRTLPAEIGQLTALKMLNISYNALETLPTTVSRLINLTDLLLTGNKLTGLPLDLGRLRELRNLGLSTNKLTTLPDNLAQCTRLTSLAVDNNPLTYLPNGLGELSSLVTLSLNKTRLGTLPASVGKLVKLNRLSVSGGHLAALPESLGNCLNLTDLIVSDSVLAALPASFSRLTNLESLNLDLPQLRLLPPGLTGFAKLRSLTIKMPQLVVLPDDLGKLGSLSRLWITGNKLMGLPNSIGKLARLEQLTLDGGVEPITNKSLGMLEQLPDSITRCEKLYSLVVRNQLAFDGADAIRKTTSLTALTSLNLDHCGIDRLTDIDWKTVTLRQLSLSQNSLRNVPEAILEAPRLEQINFSYNYPLPRALNQSFWNKDGLRTAFVEARLATTTLPTDKPDARIMQAYMNAAMRQAQQRNWGETVANFEKAILAAPDSLKSLPLAQRAELYLFRKEHALAVSDLEQAIAGAPNLKQGIALSMMPMPVRPAALVAQWWSRLGTARSALGQYKQALTELNKALDLLPKDENPALRATIYIQQGKVNANLEKPADARTSLMKANDVYTAMEVASPGERLTEVELAILTNQPDKATAALAQYRKYYANEGIMGGRGAGNLGGYTTLQEYLTTCTAVIKGTQTPEQAITALTTYLKATPERIYSWSFDLFETMLPRIGLPADKVAALGTLTKLTKEQAVKVE